MSEEILVNYTPMETRVAVVENDSTQDFHIERSLHRGIVGNIYAGKVVRVLPGMQAAFIDIGQERTGFLHMSDMLALDSSGRESKNQGSGNIADYVHDGMKIVVQVTKDPMATKGARVTNALSIPARYLVLLPQTDHIGVSQQIADADERNRLQSVLAQQCSALEMTDSGGFILRTAAQGADPGEIASDLRFLKRLWSTISLRAHATQKVELLHQDLPLHLRIVRDLVRPSVTRIVIDSHECFASVQDFCRSCVPEVLELLEEYSGEQPLFDLRGVEDDIQWALEPQVALKSGGYLVIDQTEAMTTIDVNTGSFVGDKNQAQTILKTNLEAATALARQLRLRNLGGIIIIDFIDMEDPEHRRQVHQTLETAMQSDPARNQITAISELGLVEMTRKRTRESLEQLLCEDCAVCHGRGVMKTAETVCYEIFREIMRDGHSGENDTLVVQAAQPVVDRLMNEESIHIADLAKFVGKTISFRVEPEFSQDRFDIIPQ